MVVADLVSHHPSLLVQTRIFLFYSQGNIYISISWEPEAKEDTYFQLALLSRVAYT